MSSKDYLQILRERGLIKQISNEEGLVRALQRPITLYCGYDPTAAALTAGHLFPSSLLRHAQIAGHRPICLIGGATGMVGDPTGRSAQRNALSPAQVEENLVGIRGQLSRLLDLSVDQGMVANNSDWHGQFHLLNFLREVGVHFNVAPMLATEAYETRLATGLTFSEFTYMLLQAYDFLHLNREYGCILQVGGSDQWANSLAGADLIRRVTGGTAYVLVAPLLTTSSGAKMGKSTSGTIWLSAELTSPYEFYQYWISVDDAAVEPLLAQLTLIPMDEVRRLGRLQGAELRVAKQILALDVTTWVHGSEAAEHARAASHALFGSDGGSVEDAPTVEVTADMVARGLRMVDLLAVVAQFAPSRSAARILIEQGGASINGRRITEVTDVLQASDFGGGFALLQAGKKKRCRVVIVG
jgi:tyrosyl-tRNA synthetase